jgi:hypothetical protein
VPQNAGVTSACVSIRKGLIPSIIAAIAMPLGCSSRCVRSLRRIEHRGAGRALHLIDTDLRGRAKAVLDLQEYAVGIVAISLKLEDSIDDMLERLRTRYGAVLSDMPDQEYRYMRILGKALYLSRTLAYLRDAARRRSDIYGV